MKTNEKMRKGLLRFNASRRKMLIETMPFEDLPKPLRMRILFEERGYKCEKCDFEYYDETRKQKGPFEPHHKDGDNSNWKKENIEILCLNCHWKTPNYRFRGRKHTKETKEKLVKNNYWRNKYDRAT